MAAPVIIQLNNGDKVNRFTVFKKLGEGTFGAVYAVREDNGAEHALKAELATEKIPVGSRTDSDFGMIFRFSS